MTVLDAYRRELTLPDAKACVGAGWGPLVERLYNACDHQGVAILQIKEKFGGLRFYVGGASDSTLQLIEAAEDESRKTCELCGKAGGQRVERGWVWTRCDECWEKQIGQGQS